MQISAWDQAISTFPSATFFHSAVWPRILQECYAYQPAYLTEGIPENPIAVLPLMEVNSVLTGRRAVSLPFADECEPLTTNPSHLRSIFANALNYASARSWRTIEIRGGHSAFPEAPASMRFWGHQLRIDNSEKVLFDALNSSCRRAIRKAEQSNLTLDISQSLESTKEFYKLLELTRRRHGLPPQPFSLFRSLQRNILDAGKGCVMIAKQGKIAVAGAVFLHFGKTVLFKFGASDHHHQQLRGNNFVMWHALKWHATRGFEKMDFGRTSFKNEGLRAFKQSWGSQERMVNYIKYDCQARKWIISPDRSTGLHSSFFKFLPIPLSRWVGQVLYRHFA